MYTQYLGYALAVLSALIGLVCCWVVWYKHVEQIKTLRAEFRNKLANEESKVIALQRKLDVAQMDLRDAQRVKEQIIEFPRDDGVDVNPTDTTPFMKPHLIRENRGAQRQ